MCRLEDPVATETTQDGFQADRNSALFISVLHCFVVFAAPALLWNSAVVDRQSLMYWMLAEAVLAIVAFLSFIFLRRGDVTRFIAYSRAESLGTALTFSAFAWLGDDIASLTPSKHVLMIALIAVTSVSALNSSSVSRRRPFFRQLVVIVGFSYTLAFLLKNELTFALLTILWCITISVLSRVGYHSTLELLELRRASEKTARHDDLTGLLSRSAFFNTLERTNQHAKNSSESILVLFDLDGFKAINDSFGHAAGDSVLQAVSRRLELFLPADATLGRLGGDEFAAVLTGDAGHLQKTILAALAAVGDPIQVESRELYVAASAGWTALDRNEESAVLMAQADAAMYRSKNTPSMTSTGFNADLRGELDRSLDLRQRFRTALRRNEIKFCAQPIVRSLDGAPIAVELLARWPQPDDTIVGPEEFTRVADETGLAVDLDRQALETARDLLVEWTDHPILGSLTVKANISPMHLHNSALVATVEELIPVPLRHRLGLEFVESRLITAAERHHEQLRELMEMGIVLSVDDFGVGYSSLAYLRTLPVSEIKIDRSFITDVDTDVINQGLIRAIVDISTTLGLPTIAEGIENEAELAEINRLGVIGAQGYVISRPLPLDVASTTLVAMADTATTRR